MTKEKMLEYFVLFLALTGLWTWINITLNFITNRIVDIIEYFDKKKNPQYYK